MFLFKRRRRNGRRDDVRADIGDLAESSAEETVQEEPDTGQAAMADDGIPDSVPPEDRDLMRESRKSREAAREKNRRDDQMRQTVFACACVVAGFCGIAGVIFGTAAVCKELATGPGSAAASGNTVTAPYIQGVDPGDMNVYYDQSGRMHVNIYVSRQPDVDVNIRIDGEGNVTSETVPSGQGGTQDNQGGPADTDAPGGDQASTGDQPGTGEAPGTDEDPGGDQSGEVPPGEGDNSGQAGDGQGDTGQPPAGGNKTEDQLLKEFDDRRDNGGSGYLDSDGTYLVQRGDTLTKVSRLTGFSVDFLAYYNQLKDKNLIITGETLRYPSN